jgi:gliding motility-associated-like protein
LYDLAVTPDPEIGGNTADGTYTSATDLTETLINTGRERHKVVYRFIPRITPDDGGPDCIGPEQIVTIWVHPRVQYTKIISDYNGFNISCYGKSNGFIKINPNPDLAPYTFRWTGPLGFTASTQDISGLIAGQYVLSITDVNNCTVTETFDLTEPARFSMTIAPSVSTDGNYNISCCGAQTGFVNLTAVNNVGPVDYLWIDGYLGSRRTNMSAGTYKIILTDSNNCHADSTVTLTEPDPIEIAFDKIDPFCPEARDGEISITVTGGVGGNYIYRWTDNSTERTLSNIPEGWYKVDVTDMNICTVTDSAKLTGMNKICLIIPDAFSPNRDMVNDVWNIENIELYPKVEITIYNRWGQTLWQSTPGYPVPWNGRSRGEDLPIDTYHYFIDLKNGAKPFVGDVTIVR